MKKIIAIALFIIVLLPFCASAQEKRLGVGFGHPNTVLTFSYDPWAARVAYDFTSGEQFMFLEGSYTLINSRPAFAIFTASVGIGAFALLEFEDNDFSGGVNIPISMELPLLDDFIEIYLEVAPGLELFPKPRMTWKSTCVWLGATLRLD